MFLFLLWNLHNSITEGNREDGYFVIQSDQGRTQLAYLHDIDTLLESFNTEGVLLLYFDGMSNGDYI